MIDTEALKNLPDEYKPILVNYEEMFRTKGFTQLMEWARNFANEKKERILLAHDWSEYIALRAEWLWFEQLCNLEESTYKEFEAIAAQVEGARIEEIELEYE